MTARSKQTDKAAQRNPRPPRTAGGTTARPSLLMATTAAARRRATASPLPHAGALRQAPHGNGRAFPPASPLPGAQEDS